MDRLAVPLLVAVIIAYGPYAAWAQDDSPVESRGLSLPRVTVPAPPAVSPPPAMQRLTVRTIGDGSGKVPLPPAASCPPNCSAQYPHGTPVLLAPVPAPGSRFDGWSGDCHGTGPCTLRMDRPMTAEARFTKLGAAPAPPTGAPLVTPAGPAAVPIPYPVVPSTLGPELTAISTMLADGKPTNAILDTWKAYVTKHAQAKQSWNVQGTIDQVLQQAQAQLKARTDAAKGAMDKNMASVGDDAQLANVDLQNQVQKQQQTLQMLSNMSKMMHDTAMATIRKIGG